MRGDLGPAHEHWCLRSRRPAGTLGRGPPRAATCTGGGAGVSVSVRMGEKERPGDRESTGQSECACHGHAPGSVSLEDAEEARHS